MSRRYNKCCKKKCAVDAETYGKMEICGEGIREALAELFCCGGTVEMKVCMEVDPECGCVDRIIIKGEGPMRIKTEDCCC